jgi:hypothetical protein
MKKIIVLLTFSIFILFSCSSSNEENNTSINTNELVNTWLLKQALLNGNNTDSSNEIRFTTDKKVFFTYYNYGSNGQNITETGNYTINGNIIIINWDSADPGLETANYDILELTSSKLVLKSVISGEGTLIETYTK